MSHHKLVSKVDFMRWEKTVTNDYLSCKMEKLILAEKFCLHWSNRIKWWYYPYGGGNVGVDKCIFHFSVIYKTGLANGTKSTNKICLLPPAGKYKCIETIFNLYVSKLSDRLLGLTCNKVQPMFAKMS